MPIDEDPRGAVSIAWSTWTPAVAGEPIAQPPGSSLGAVLPGQGILAAGELAGAGWDDAATPEPIVGLACGSTGTRAPIVGDYRYDADVFGITLPEGGRLCASAGVADAETGIDLLLFELDTCGVPTRLVADDGGAPLGFGRAGPSVRWAADLEAGGTFAVLIASYAPDAEAARLPYSLGLSVLADAGSLCPLRPGEVSP